MKKIKLLMMTLLITVLAVGCSKGSEQGGETGETSPKQIITKIQETKNTIYNVTVYMVYLHLTKQLLILLVLKNQKEWNTKTVYVMEE